MTHLRWIAILGLTGALGCSSATPDPLKDSGTPPTDDPAPTDNPVPTDNPIVTDQPVTPTDQGLTCGGTQTACGSTCTDTSTDATNCGMCGRACSAGQTCAAGTCTNACTGAQTLCSGSCVDTTSDIAHCGMCGHACAAMESCVTGMCRAAQVCPPGQTDCGGACIDTTMSAMHCGGCGMACLGTESCMSGVCVPTTCMGSLTRCGSACVNTAEDGANCGMCGHACSATETCNAGACVASCAAPSMICAVSGSMVCLDVTTDVANCGMCGRACTAGQSCVAGACACGMGETACSGACVNTMTNNANCGMCGRACAAGQSCVAGSCACPTGQALCGTTCVSTQSDIANCGMCGRACTAPSTCNMGTCNSACGAGTTSCGGRCVATTTFATDLANCGACGNVCPARNTCAGGRCQPVNDTRATATRITLGAAESSIAGTTLNATHDGPTVPCGCTSGGDVWYTFTLTAPEVVYFDTAGSGPVTDTSLIITDSAGAAVTAQPTMGNANLGLCNDDAQCAGDAAWSPSRDSQTVGVLAAGTYYVVVGSCTTGPFTLHAQHFAVAGTGFFYRPILAGSGITESTNLIATAGTSGGTCGGSTSGEDGRWFVTCGGGMRQQLFSLCQSDGGTFTRRTNATYFDPALYIRSAQTGAEVVCNDDGGSMGGTMCAGTVSGTGGTSAQDASAYGSRINNVTVPRGLNVVVIDERTRTPTTVGNMFYRMRYVIQ